MGPRNLQFIIEYIKDAKVYKLHNRQIYVQHGVLVT